MHPEAAFLAGYALVLVLGASGLESLGRRPTSPWKSRTLTACKPADEPADDGAAWPHSAAPAFHRAVSAVALAAALLITAVSAFRHHGPLELSTHGGLLVLIAARIRGLTKRHHHPACGEPYDPTRRTIHTPATPTLRPETRQNRDLPEWPVA